MDVGELFVIEDDKSLDFEEEEWLSFLETVQNLLEKHAGDRVQVILELQRDLDSFIDAVRGINRDDAILWVRRNALAGLMEVTEFIDGLNWKWWTNKKAVDKKYLLEELADILHFLASAMNTVGMTSADIVKISHKDTLSDVFRMVKSIENIEGLNEEKAIKYAVELAGIFSEIYEADTEDVMKIELNIAFRRLVAMTLSIDETADNLFKAYVIKNFKNRARQKSKRFRGGQYFAER